MESEVTVLIPTYNAGSFLKEAIETVFKQTYEHWKLIVVDDASTDESIAIAKPYLADPRVTYMCNERNIGQSKTMNVGLAAVTTPYVIQLDADDWFFPYTLEVLLAEARNQPEHVGLISGNINSISINPSGGLFFNIVTRNRSFRDKYDFLLSNMSQWPRFYRTSTLKSIGGWPADDPYEGRYMEDKRVLMRLIEVCHFHWIDVPLYIHRRHHHNQTNLIDIYREITEWNIRDALKRWGDEYDPVFMKENGWIKIVDLRPKAKRQP
ncbi:glycosyltransferase family 2 protein [Paenibacillus montanisoli]|uniref:Glycosyltransferase family 2 protein n=1 Tax=Paenibacillus montanisoli TaxID=2081970 RepID=A0A328U415_9BACL|nr:glycosyltransferase family A protein [Paenibacillus montanisoli]RAP76792.1 glycosyltransferase family 2 protein [Paenibacillus montanisoli]